MRTRKRFGQHFLEAAWADKLVAAIEPQPADRFLEIGPGPGALTLRLAPRVAHLTAVEVDRDLAAALGRGCPPNVDLIVADFLDLDLRRAAPSPAAARRRQPSLQHLVADPVPADRCARPTVARASDRAGGTLREPRAREPASPDRRCDADAAAGSRRADRGAPGTRRLRRAVHLRAAACRRPPHADAAARRLPAGAEGPLGGRPADVPAPAGRRSATSGCSRRWSGRCSPSGGRRWRTPWPPSPATAGRRGRRPRGRRHRPHPPAGDAGPRRSWPGSPTVRGRPQSVNSLIF